MKAKKKGKTKAKTAAKKKKAAAKKTVKKKAAKKKVVKRKALARKPARKPAARKAAPRPKPATAPARPVTPAALPGEERVGMVTHYYSHLSVAVVKLDSGMLREGDTIHIKGHTSDFRQRVTSIEVDHVHVPEARAGQSFGLKVSEHAREHDVVYKVVAPRGF